ncbi:MAG TPA: acetyl-CoA C-acetyltransferase [Saprospirales bacterium]|nr:acetyl-CoA C-acetyltransferase [Saprospirales bacterium]HRQ31329.1 thiolase family protein [Saprospiraceae bacterium]
MEKVYIISAVRTPLGSFGGALAGFTAVELGSKAIRGAVEKAGIKPELVEELYFGNVVQANSGQAPARQAALGAGLPNTVPCTTVNKVCASGMKSIVFGAQSIQLGQNHIVIAGGMESMSNCPYYIPKARWGYKYGNAELIDGLEKDGLLDAYAKQAMGVFADNTAKVYEISREEQDNFAIQSYKKSAAAAESGAFDEEIIPVEIPQRNKEPLVMKVDEEFKKVFFDKIPGLRPAFTKDGTVTAANASTMNDGATALVLASEEAVKKYGLKPIAEILSYADAAHEPEWFTTAPTKAAKLAMERAGLNVQDADLYEVNEAFAVVTLAFNKMLGIDPAKVNVHGGAVSLGHPLGASGARIVTTLIHALHRHNKSIGLATLCNGGGGAGAIVVKKI